MKTKENAKKTTPKTLIECMSMRCKDCGYNDRNVCTWEGML